MARRLSFQIRVGSAWHTLPGWRWKDLVHRNLVVVSSPRRAYPAPGMAAFIQEGSLRLINSSIDVSVYIGSSWDLIERHAMYDVSARRLSPADLQREIQAQYCERGPE